MIGGNQLQSNSFLPFGKVRMGLKVWMGLRSGWVILSLMSVWIKLNLCAFNYFVYFCIPIILYTVTP